MIGGVTRHIMKQALRYGKTGTKKSATCFATLLQNKLNSDVGRFTTLIKPVLQQIRLLTGLYMGGKTRINAIQLVLQQCCKTLTPAPAPTRAPAAKNLNVTNFFATKQQVSPALSLNLMVLTLGI